VRGRAEPRPSSDTAAGAGECSRLCWDSRSAWYPYPATLLCSCSWRMRSRLLELAADATADLVAEFEHARNADRVHGVACTRPQHSERTAA